MKTSTIKQQVALMLGAVIILLTMLCLLFLDTKYLTSSVRIIFIIGAVVGGLCLMQGMTTKTTVEIEQKSILPTKELQEQQCKIHDRKIAKLNQLIEKASLLEDNVDDILRERVTALKLYLYDQLGIEQGLRQGLEWNIESDDNKRAWDNLDKCNYTLNPITGDKFWYKSDGMPYTISVYDYKKLTDMEREYSIKSNKLGMKVRE